MFAWLIAQSAQRPARILVAAGALLIAVAWLLPRFSVDVFPELNAPTVAIMTEAGGLSVEEVEQQVTIPLESAVRGLTGLRQVRASSTLGLSFVWAEFEWGEDLWRARALVAERLSGVRESLPAQAHAEIAPVTSLTGEILLLSLTATGPTPATAMQLRHYAEFELANRLLAVPGIAQVATIGGELGEYQVICRQERLDRYDLTVSDVAAAAAGAHRTGSAGLLRDHQGLELAVKPRAQIRSADDLAATLVAWRHGQAVRLGDVAEVRLGPAMSRGDAAENGRMAVILTVQKAPGTNTLALTAAVDRALDAAVLPSGMALNREVFRQAEFIEQSIFNLRKALVEAALIVAVVLVLILVDVRAALITLTALPLSLAAAFAAMWLLGLSINVMTLGGLAVALGGLVDDAIIDVENVLRRLAGCPPAERRARIVAASNDIRQPMVFATAIIVLVFVPLLFLGGLEGRFFQPLGIAYIISTLASLLVAVTVTPALCVLLLRARPAAAHAPGAVARWLLAAYRPVLATALRWRRGVVVGSAALAVGALVVAGTFGSSFLPTFLEGAWQVQIMAPPGTSLAESARLVHGVEARIAQIPGVRHVARRTGRAERDAHAEPPSSSEMNVTIEPGRQMEVRQAIDAILAEIAALGITTSVGQPIEHRLSHVLSGVPAALAVTVSGDDLPLLRRAAQRIADALTQLPEARDIVANREVTTLGLPVTFRNEALTQAGLSSAEAARQLTVALGGESLATISDGPRRHELRVMLHRDEIASPQALGEIMLRSPHGPLVRLREVADLTPQRDANLIARDQGQRKAVVSCNVAVGHNLGDLASRAQAVIDPIVRELGLRVHYGGQAEAQQHASATLRWMGLGVLAAVAWLLAMSLKSWGAALIVLLNLPLALIGGIAAVLLSASANPLANLVALGTGHGYVAPVLSIASLVGFITLFGIAVRNGILLVGAYQQLRHAGADVRTAIAQGSQQRLIAIIMTALTAVLGLIPLAMLAGQPGAELLAPLAVVVLGGLITSTALNLIVIPAAYAWAYEPRSAAPSSPSTPESP